LTRAGARRRHGGKKDCGDCHNWGSPNRRE
jgi:hypothetical protein